MQRLERPEYIADTRRVQRALEDNGLVVDLFEAEQIWQRHSDTFCASWLNLPDEDKGSEAVWEELMRSSEWLDTFRLT
jgi:hypothetical protein